MTLVSELGDLICDWGTCSNIAAPNEPYCPKHLKLENRYDAEDAARQAALDAALGLVKETPPARLGNKAQQAMRDLEQRRVNAVKGQPGEWFRLPGDYNTGYASTLRKRNPGLNARGEVVQVDGRRRCHLWICWGKPRVMS